MTPTKLVIHHSASARTSTTKQKIAQWHTDKGYTQIGYHKVIEANGTAKDGRSESTMGAHAAGANGSSLGVCVCGNFNSERPTAAQITGLVDVLANWCKNHNLKETAIYGHRNVPGGTTQTDCPGTHLFSKMATIKSKVKAKL